MAITTSKDSARINGTSPYPGWIGDQCLLLNTTSEQVACSSQHLNITDPPSEYSYGEYPTQWDYITCLLYNVSYHHRYDMDSSYNYCVVPLTGQDAFLFVSLALLMGCILFGRLSAVALLVAGGIVGTLNYYVNMLQVSNALALWLNIQPPFLFFYAFLPPLVVDSTIQIDFFLFRKLWVHSVMLAFVMVIVTCLVGTPFILFVLRFAGRGWSWVHAALFIALIAPTDAVSVAAVLKSSGGPRKLVCLLEGESLLNDATAFALFDIFFQILLHSFEDSQGVEVVYPSVWSTLPTIAADVVRLTAIGMAIGVALSVVTGWLLRWLRWRGAPSFIDTTVVLANAYLAFYVANSPAKGSGLIAVVLFGLYGNATSKWGMLSSEENSQSFDAAWAMISFVANSLVFFWSGVSGINFFIRSIELVFSNGWNIAAIPILFLFMIAFRIVCLFMFNPLFHWMREGLTWQEVIFSGWAGLRGSTSLMLIAALTTTSNIFQGGEGPDDGILADIALWTAAFVFLTLCINAPSLGFVMRLLKLNNISADKRKIRSRSKKALCRFTEVAITNLRDDDDEFLDGADWTSVAAYVDMSKELPEFDLPARAKEVNAGATLIPSHHETAIRRMSTAFNLPMMVLQQKKQSDLSSTTTPIKDSVSHQPSYSTDEEGSDFECWRSNVSVDSLVDELQVEVPYLNSVPYPQMPAEKAPKQVDAMKKLEEGNLYVDKMAIDDDAETRCISGKEAALLQAELQKRLSTKQEAMEDDLYCYSCPVAVRAELTQQLEESQQKEKIIQAEASVSSTSSGKEPRIEDSYHSLPAGAGHALAQELRREMGRSPPFTKPSEAFKSSETMPAHVGDQMKRELQKQLSKKRRPPIPSSYTLNRSVRGSSRLNDYGETSAHHMTVSGAAGAGLAAELKKRMSDKDWLPCRRKSFPDEVSVPVRGFKSDQVGMPMSAMLERKRSNRHVVQRATVKHGRRTNNIELQSMSQLKEPAISSVGKVHDLPKKNKSCKFPISEPEGASEPPQVDVSVEREWRRRLISGLLRYFHGKRQEGLLSTTGMRILEYACEKELEESLLSKPLGMWPRLEKEVRGSVTSRLLARTSFTMTQMFRGLPGFLQIVFAWPYKHITGWVRAIIGRRMLVACEVAVEYHMALLYSPQVQWTQSHAEAWQLQPEIEAEAEASKKFIVQREIEAPDRFQAIQSYRATMAVLRQQLLFVDELFETGVLDKDEKGKMHAPIDRKLRRLEITGPIWRPPRAINVLRALPFMAGLPEPVFRKIHSMATVRPYRSGQQIWSSHEEPNPGAFVVVSGVVKTLVQKADGSEKEYYRGIGSVIGLLRTMTGHVLPGSSIVVAEGNVLGKGPVLYQVPQSLVEYIERKAAAGDPALIQMHDDLMRICANRLIASSEDQLYEMMKSHVRSVALGRARAAWARKYKLQPKVLAPPRPSNLPITSPLPKASSVAAKLAAMMQELATLEVDEDEDEDEKKHDQDRKASSQTDRSTDGFRQGSEDHPPNDWLEKKVESALRRSQGYFAELMGDLKRECSHAAVFHIGKGVKFPQCSHMVLLRGELQNTGSLEIVGAPCVLPWLWDPHLHCNTCGIEDLELQEAPFVGWASWSAATLVVYHNDDSKEAMEPLRLASDNRALFLPTVENKTREESSMSVADASGSEQGSIGGGAASVMGRELTKLLSGLKRNK